METWTSGPGAARAGNAPDEQHCLQKKSGSGWGGRRPGHLAQEPPDPEMRRMSSSLFRKRAVLEGGGNPEIWARSRQSRKCTG